VGPARHVRHKFPLKATSHRHPLPPVDGSPVLRVLRGDPTPQTHTVGVPITSTSPPPCRAFCLNGTGSSIAPYPGFPLCAQIAVYHPSRRPAHRNVWGLPSSQRFSLCMPGPVDPDRPSGLSPGRDLCVGFQCVQTVAICIDRFDEAVPDFRVYGHPSGLQSSLCTLHTFCSVLDTSSTYATLGTSGWLNLTRWGLAPHKKRQALLGARTLGVSRWEWRERGTSGRYSQSASG